MEGGRIMFKIYDGREHFYQWDLDRKLIVGDRTIQAVHFCNRTGACAITRDCYDVNGMWLVDVPNLCLQESYRLKVYGFSAAKYTTVSSQFDVKSRTKPDGYVYTDDEINCWQDLDQRVAALEENPVSDEAIAAGIDKYLIENPIEVGATDAEKEQIARNTEDIAALKSKADTHATEEYVDAAVANVKVDVDLTGYATEEYVDNAIANIDVGGGGSAIEYVNATGEETIELDKTYEEIMAMIDAGKVVVINYNGNLYHQFSDSPNFRYVGNMENRVISFNKRDYSVRYSENIIPAYEDVGTIVEEMLEDRNYQTAEQVNAAIEAYVGVIENGTY